MQVLTKLIGTYFVVAGALPEAVDGARARIRARSDRGGQEGISTLLLIGGAIAICAIIVAGVTAYVKSHIPK